MKGIHSAEGNKYLVALAGCLFLVATRFLAPEYIDNEWSYSINPIKILNPTFLQGDYFFDRVYPYFIVYDGLVSPLYRYLDYFVATVLCRVGIWIFQIFALSRLCRTLGVKWWGFFLLFVLWLNVEQTLVAGEWIIGAASSKPVAYGFLFLSLDSMLKGKRFQSGMYAGLGASFHVLVGAWSALALSGVHLYKDREKPLMAASYLLPMLVFALPGMIPALFDTFKVYRGAEFLANPAMAPEVARLSVRMATPFHLDPGYFLGGLEYLKVFLFFAFSVWLPFSLMKREIAVPVVVYTGILIACFLSGIVAWRFQWYGYLQYYPFRVADSFVPLLFWICAVLGMQKISAWKHFRPVYLVVGIPLVISMVNMANDLMEPGSVRRIQISTLAANFLKTEPRTTAYWTRETVKEWRRYCSGGKKDDMREMEAWIRDNTLPSSVFIVPPWQKSFALYAQRPQFVKLLIPSNYKIIEWKKRIEMLDRGPLKTMGRELWPELKENFVKLDTGDLLRIKASYPVDYFLTISRIPLDFQLVKEIGEFRLYRL